MVSPGLMAAMRCHSSGDVSRGLGRAGGGLCLLCGLAWVDGGLRGGVGRGGRGFGAGLDTFPFLSSLLDRLVCLRSCFVCDVLFFVGAWLFENFPLFLYFTQI